MPRALLLVIVALLLVGLLLYSQRSTGPLHVSGFIEADEIRVGSRVGGRVLKVHVEEGQRVTKGTLLVELEPFDLKERLAQAVAERASRKTAFDKLTAGFRPEEIAQAKARVDQLEAKLLLLQNGPRKQEIAAAQARLRQASALLELMQTQFNRVKTLFEKNATNRDEMDRAINELKAATESHRVREEELNLLMEGTRVEELAQAKAQVEESRQAFLLMKNGYRAEDIEEARVGLEAADAAVRVFESQLAELSVKSPVDGVIEALELQPGDLVGAGAPILSIMDTSHLWVRAYLPENHLDVQVDQKVKVGVDSFPDRRFNGHISFVARQAEFTPGNVQTPEERSKQVFRIKVTLDEALDELRPGMTADVYL